jgi:hypothetical protein
MECGPSIWIQVYIHIKLQVYIHIKLQVYIHIKLQVYIHIKLQVYTYMCGYNTWGNMGSIWAIYKVVYR